jgi:hypothetical protein
MHRQTQVKLAISKYKSEVIRPRVSQQLNKKNRSTIEAEQNNRLPLYEFFALPAVQAIINTSNMDAEIDERVVIPLEIQHTAIYQEYLDMREKKNQCFTIIQSATARKQKLTKLSAYCTSSISIIVKFFQDSVVNFLSSISKQISNVYAVINRNIRVNMYANEITTIISPASLSTRSIVGIMWNLHHKYSTVTHSTLTHAYMDILTELISSDEFEFNPKIFLTRLNDKHSIWKRDNLFQLLTEDMLWSLWTLRGIPETSAATEFRKIMYKQFYSALEKYPIAASIESDGSSNSSVRSSNTSVNRMHIDELPIYSMLLKRADDYFTNELVLDNPNSNRSTVNSPNRAFVATHIPTATIYPTKLPTPSTHMFDGFKSLPAQKFTGPIGPNSKFYIVNRGRKYSYTATVEPCPKCASATTTDRCIPSCFKYSCTNCQQYGHHKGNCHQA